MPVLRAVVGQEQQLGAGHTLTEYIQEALRLPIDPMQVFKDQNQRLVETFAQEQLLERLKGAPPPNLRVHLLQRRGLLFNAEQRKQIGQRVFQAAVEHEDFATDFLASFARIILGLDIEVDLQQL